MNASDIGAVYKAKAIIHDSCTLPQDQTKESAQLTLLRKVKDLEIVEPIDTWPGCGMGGGLDRKNEALTVGMAEEFLKSIASSGADTIISNDPLCLMHLQGVIDKNKLPLKVIHLADVLASGWD